MKKKQRRAYWDGYREGLKDATGAGPRGPMGPAGPMGPTPPPPPPVGLDVQTKDALTELRSSLAKDRLNDHAELRSVKSALVAALDILSCLRVS